MLLHDDPQTTVAGARPLDVPVRKASHSTRNSVLIAVSLANLCFINSWYLVAQIPTQALNYYRKAPPDMTLLWATLISVGLLATAFWAGWRLVIRSGNPLAIRFAKGLYLIILSYPVEKLVQFFSPPPDEFSYACAVALIVLETTLLMGVMLVVLFGTSAILRIACGTTLTLAFLFPAIAFNLFWMWAASPGMAAFQDHKLAGPVAVHHPAASRVVWMIFDEMDQGMLFDYRHPSVKVPHLDALRGEAFYADQVTPVARWTMLALPALLDGQRIFRAELANDSDLRMWLEGQQTPVHWRDQANIFSRSRAKGMNTAILGWHHPYCRVLNESLSQCFWQSSEQGGDNIEVESHTRRIGLLKSVLFLLESKVENVISALNIPFESKSQADIQRSLRIAQVDLFSNIRERALKAVVDPQLDVMVFHWPTPHPYGIFDPATGQYSTDSKLSYLDNLALVDRTVAEVQQALAKAGMADGTTLLVSSDHPFRREIWQDKFRWPRPMLDAVNANGTACVPFLVKFGGDRRGVEYHEKFDAVLTGEIVQRIAEGEIRSGAELARWLDENRAKASSE